MHLTMNFPWHINQQLKKNAIIVFITITICIFYFIPIYSELGSSRDNAGKSQPQTISFTATPGDEILERSPLEWGSRRLGNRYGCSSLSSSAALISAPLLVPLGAFRHWEMKRWQMPNVTCNADSPRYQIPAGAETEPWKWQIQIDSWSGNSSAGSCSIMKTPTFL